MRSSLLKTVGAAAAAACVVFATAAPAVAGEWWRRHNLWQSDWQAVYLHGGLDGVIRTGSPDPRIGPYVLGKYPYHAYGYNNGACIGYEWIYDCSGNVVGQAPVLVC